MKKKEAAKERAGFGGGDWQGFRFFAVLFFLPSVVSGCRKLVFVYLAGRQSGLGGFKRSLAPSGGFAPAGAPDSGSPGPFGPGCFSRSGGLIVSAARDDAAPGAEYVIILAPE